MIEAEGLKKAFGDNLLYDNLSFNLPKGGIVGVVGPNGAGKTTLFRIINGQEQPDAGEFRIGETVQVAHVIVDESSPPLNRHRLDVRTQTDLGGVDERVPELRRVSLAGWRSSAWVWNRISQ